MQFPFHGREETLRLDAPVHSGCFRELGISATETVSIGLRVLPETARSLIVDRHEAHPQRRTDRCLVGLPRDANSVHSRQ